MNYFAVIVAGGKGVRMNAGMPKQFMLLFGQPVLMHSILRFHKSGLFETIYVALPSGEIATWNSLCDQHDFQIKHQVVEGGATRFESVKNCLSLIHTDGIIAIHDGVRPCISQDLILRCIQQAEVYGNAVPAVSVNESIRQITEDDSMASP